jgi:hypothetical protein
VIDCASIYTAVVLRSGRRENRALGPASLEGGRTCRWARWLGRSPAAGLCVGFSRGTPAPSDQRKEQPPSDRWCPKRVRQRRRRNVPLPNGTELRVYVIQSIYGLDIAGSSLTCRAHGSAIYTADDDHASRCETARSGWSDERQSHFVGVAPTLGIQGSPRRASRFGARACASESPKRSRRRRAASRLRTASGAS